ncbi:MAG: hypothetical protein AUH30_00285 [Candidatus Rokubacteria bacterium 13_1_40CM_68_15]|nr:MAG: hypothetical protein AUH30_00285 [Candidatus Rokubacteria bacterium 13_1_40CM_68_15]
MTLRRLLAVVMLVVVLVTFVRPAQAEALEPTVIILIISGAIVVVAVLAVLIIANVAEHRRGIRTQEQQRGPLVVAWQPPTTVESP